MMVVWWNREWVECFAVVKGVMYCGMYVMWYVVCVMVVKLAVFLGRQVSDMKLHTQKKVERRKYKKLNYSTTL